MEKRNASVLRLAADAALALVVRYLPTPWRLGDALLFTNARLVQWPAWSTLSAEDRQRIARYFRLRPDALADRQTFLKEAAASLSGKTRFYAPSGIPDHLPDCAFAPVNGKPIDQLTTELLDSLATALPERLPPPEPSVSNDATSVHLSAGRSAFEVPVSHLGADSGGDHPWPTLIQTPHCEDIALDAPRLLALAQRLDRSGVSETPYTRVITDLFEQLESFPGRVHVVPSLALPGRRTTLFIAPTGRGKSVFAHLAALDLAQRGFPTALVLPDIPTVMHIAHRLDREIAAVGMHLSVAPVNASDSLIEKATDLARYGARSDGFYHWALDRMVYPCQLSAYAKSPEPGSVEEPCFHLYQGRGGKERRVACPFSRGCPKFDAFRRAASADIVVVNHAAFLVGKVPLPLLVENHPVHKMPIMELVFRRCAVAFVDEIDSLQGRAIERSTGDLQLSGRRHVSPVYQLLTHFQQAKATEDLPPRLPVDGVRSKLFLTNWLAEEMADLINRGDVKWESHDALRWSGSDDGRLASRLFGVNPGDLERLDAIFEDIPISNDHAAEDLRQSVAMWSRRTMEDDLDTVQLRAHLMSVLDHWPIPLKLPQRAWVADALIRRAVLSRLERVLAQLRPHLGVLEQYGLDAAARIRDDLLGYTAWGPSPLGALGRRVVGFVFRRHADDAGALHARGLVGDPHGLIAGLGEVSALALAGEPRAVVGLSATAWFPGSPKSDVLSPIWLVQPDASDGVSIHGVMVSGQEGQPLRVSGEPSPSRRLGQVSQLAFSMWDQFLREHLKGLASHEDTRDRAKVLIVTGSYPETHRASEALSKALGGAAESSRRLRYVVRGSGADHDGPNSQAIPPREIDSFGKSEADILIAPLGVIARGHNIVVPGSNGKSAIASIFVLVRPVPPDNAARLLAHLSYETNRRGPFPGTVAEAIEAEQRYAERCLYEIRKGTGPFGAMPSDLRHAVLCDVLVDLAQLAGRCRRGGTNVSVYLVDGAFHDAHVGWYRLVREAFNRWASNGDLNQMRRVHRAFLKGLGIFAGLGADSWTT